jgi:hypothetical protein
VCGPSCPWPSRPAPPRSTSAAESRAGAWGHVRRALLSQRLRLPVPGEQTLRRWFRLAGLPPGPSGRRMRGFDPDDAEATTRRQADGRWLLRVLQG